MIKLAIILLAIFLKFTSSTNLPFELNPNESLCFYESTKTVPAKCSFFFAVHKGDKFEVNYKVLLPDGTQYFNEFNKAQGDFVFTLQQVGDYGFCFENPINDHKIVDIDVRVEFTKEKKSHLKFHNESAQNSMNSLDSMILHIETILKTFQFFKAEQDRETASLNNVVSNVKWFVLTMIASSLALVAFSTFSVKYLFSKQSKGF